MIRQMKSSRLRIRQVGGMIRHMKSSRLSMRQARIIRQMKCRRRIVNCICSVVRNVARFLFGSSSMCRFLYLRHQCQ